MLIHGLCDECVTTNATLNWNSCRNSDIWLENRSQNEYGCHTPQLCRSLRENVCIHCTQRKPALLEELCFSVILENSELLKRANSILCHLPHRICWLIGRALNANLISKAWQLVPFISEYDQIRPSWFEVDQTTATILPRLRLYCEVSQKLKPYMICPSAGIDKIFHYFSNADSSFKDFWSEMTSAMKTLKAEIHNEDLKPLNNVICADVKKVVFVEAKKLTGDEFESMKELQRLSKTFSCPVLFKPTKIELYELESDGIPHFLDDVDPEVIIDVDIERTAWSVADIDELGRVLLACKNLSGIYLRQKPMGDEVVEDLAPAVSRLLSQHHHLEKIGLTGFNLEGTFTRYPLPPVENLRLRAFTLADEDWNFMANRSDLALKTLVVSSYFYGDDLPSLPIFIQNQAKSLENLTMEYPTLTVEEICESLRNMARFSKLEMFDLYCLEEIDFVSIEKIVAALMSIHSAKEFFIDIPSYSDEEDLNDLQEDIDQFLEAVAESYKVNRRPPLEIHLKIYQFE